MEDGKILIIGQIGSDQAELPELLTNAGFRVHRVDSGEEALRYLRGERGCGLALVGETTDISAKALLQGLSRRFPDTRVALLLPAPPEESIRERFLDLSGRPNRRVLEVIEGLLASRPCEGELRPRLIGRSESMERVRQTVEQVASTNMTVLITGESGTGKDVVARLLHDRSRRRAKPFVAVNCAALPEGVLESELFGHEKGAFTGATARRQGRFELADGGTLFLDEIADMPIQTQAKLLRVLEEKRFLRVGGVRDVVVDVRLAAATNADLEAAVMEGRFRRDLFYRLNVIQIHLPPLRERREDIPDLVAAFVGDVCDEQNLEPIRFTREAMQVLTSFHWPGNVRQLRNLVEKIAILERGGTIDESRVSHFLGERFTRSQNLPVPTTRDREQAERELLYQTLLAIRGDLAEMKEMLRSRGGVTGDAAARSGNYPTDAEVVELDESPERDRGRTAADFELEAIRRALKESGGNRRRAAEILQIGERTLYRKLRKHGLR